MCCAGRVCLLACLPCVFFRRVLGVCVHAWCVGSAWGLRSSDVRTAAYIPYSFTICALFWAAGMRRS